MRVPGSIPCCNLSLVLRWRVLHQARAAVNIGFLCPVAYSNYLRPMGGDCCVPTWNVGAKLGSGKRARSWEYQLYKSWLWSGTVIASWSHSLCGAGAGDAVTSCGAVHRHGEERGAITWSAEGVSTLVCCEERQTDLACSLLTLSPVEATMWTAETAIWLQCRR